MAARWARCSPNNMREGGRGVQGLYTGGLYRVQGLGLGVHQIRVI